MQTKVTTKYIFEPPIGEVYEYAETEVSFPDINQMKIYNGHQCINAMLNAGGLRSLATLLLNRADELEALYVED